MVGNYVVIQNVQNIKNIHLQRRSSNWNVQDYSLWEQFMFLIKDVREHMFELIYTNTSILLQINEEYVVSWQIITSKLYSFLYLKHDCSEEKKHLDVKTIC